MDNSTSVKVSDEAVEAGRASEADIQIIASIIVKAVVTKLCKQDFTPCLILSQLPYCKNTLQFYNNDVILHEYNRQDLYKQNTNGRLIYMVLLIIMSIQSIF